MGLLELMDLGKNKIFISFPFSENNKATQHSTPRKVRDSSPTQEKPAAISQVNTSVIKKLSYFVILLGQ